MAQDLPWPQIKLGSRHSLAADVRWQHIPHKNFSHRGIRWLLLTFLILHGLKDHLHLLQNKQVLKNGTRQHKSGSSKRQQAGVRNREHILMATEVSKVLLLIEGHILAPTLPAVSETLSETK